MAELFDMHSFCESCGAHRRRMPFGEAIPFFDSGPCARCGGYGSDYVVARRAQIGRWPWQRGWLDAEGNRVDVTAKAEEAPHA